MNEIRLRCFNAATLLVTVMATGAVGLGCSSENDPVDGGDGVGSGGTTSVTETGGTTGTGGGSTGTGSSELGELCMPYDESDNAFSGFSQSAILVELGSAACNSGICLVNHFQGRVNCPYGQSEEELTTLSATERCSTPEGLAIETPVAPQLEHRQAKDHVICSCRCDGPDTTAEYCECPGNMECVPLVENLGLGSRDTVGSYCIPQGTSYDVSFSETLECSRDAKNCGSPL